jgi:N-acetylneuraminic acid mutarotase
LADNRSGIVERVNEVEMMVAVRRTGPALLLTAATLAWPAAVRAQAPGQWAPTGSMSTARTEAALATLPDGQVLVAGGTDRESTHALASAELYDPATGIWTPTAPMLTARAGPMSVTLGDGNVLVVGGMGANNQPVASAEEYDPSTATWSPAGAMSTPRWFTTATLLSDGDVLVAGGFGPNLTLEATADLFDPLTLTWSAAGTMSVARVLPSTSPLPDGDALVAGGQTSTRITASADLYDPVTGRWTATGSLRAARAEANSTPLADGDVLVDGGGVDNQATPLATAELYDPAAGTWTRTGSMTSARAGSTASALGNGQVLVAGGKNTDTQHAGALSSAELYDPTTGTWMPTGAMPAGRTGAGATVLSSGRVLVAGGEDGTGTPVAGAQVYQPALAPQVSLAAASAVAITSADLQGAVDPEGSDTTDHFDLSMTPDFAAPTSLPATDAGAASAPGAVTAQATGLAPDTTYDVRLVAVNASGTSASPTVQFTTAPEAPAGLPVQSPGAPATARVLRVRRTARGGVRVTLTVSVAGRITVRLTARRHRRTRRFTRTFRVGSGQTVHVGRAADRWLRRLGRRGRATLTIEYRSGATTRRVLRRRIAPLRRHRLRHAPR